MPLFRSMIGFLMTTQPEAAKHFFTDLLGFPFVSDDPFALVFDAEGVQLRVVKATQFTAAHYTILGWEVENIAATVTELTRRGIAFEHYANMNPDQQGIVTFPGGDRVAWFKDPEGNVLSVSQHVHASASGR